MSRRVHVSEGLYFGVSSEGYVVNGSVNGAKLYVHEVVAARRAGKGGSVYRLFSGPGGICVERVSGAGQGVYERSIALP